MFLTVFVINLIVKSINIIKYVGLIGRSRFPICEKENIMLMGWNGSYQ